MVQDFREITINHLNENFWIKFHDSYFFHDYHHAMAPARTIYIVAPPMPQFLHMAFG